MAVLSDCGQLLARQSQTQLGVSFEGSPDTSGISVIGGLECFEFLLIFRSLSGKKCDPALARAWLNCCWHLPQALDHTLKLAMVKAGVSRELNDRFATGFAQAGFQSPGLLVNTEHVW